VPIDRQRLVMICCSDIAGQVRGKGFPAGELESRRRFGVGWTPTNVMINCFGRIPATPFGALGDLMLVSDAATETVLDFGDGMPVEHFLLGDILTLDGRPWECCLRCTLRRTLEALEQEAGLRLYASFEHEFHLFGATTRPGASYALSALRGVEPFIGDFLGALDSAGLEPDTFLPEYGPQQFEVTVRPAFGIEAADRAVRLREICRAVARRHGLQASFAPLVSYGVVGNGVHIHFSLTDREGKPVTYDPGGPGGLSAAAGSFAAGILRHSRALCAVTAPSVPSYERLKPHSWSAYYANLGLRDREALLRICPVPEISDVDPAPRYNLEYRAADAAASPYLQLAMLVWAGLEGMRDRLAVPTITDVDSGTLSDQRRAELGILDLPRSLGEALETLEADSKAMGWLGPVLSNAYLMHKRGEIGMVEGMDVAEMCQLYAQAY
jgi:glutamine synthetase